MMQHNSLANTGRQLPGLEPTLQWLALQGLTPREKEALYLVLKGLPNKVIAQEMGISPETVKVYARRILVK